MSSISKNTFLVQLLAAKTKMKLQDIIDILDLLPECMAEAFLEANPEANEKVFLGAGTVHWRPATKWGPSFIFSPTQVFHKTMTRLRMAKEYPLAEKLWNLMHPLSRERALEGFKNESEGIGSKISRNRVSKVFKVAERQKLLSVKDKEEKKRRKEKQRLIIKKIKEKIEAKYAIFHK